MLEFWASSVSPLTLFLCSVLDGISYRYVLVSSMLSVVVMGKSGKVWLEIKRSWMERGLRLSSIESGSVDDALARSGVYVIMSLVSSLQPVSRGWAANDTFTKVRCFIDLEIHNCIYTGHRPR